jgi:hypothetical protein
MRKPERPHFQAGAVVLLAQMLSELEARFDVLLEEAARSCGYALEQMK